MSKAADKPSTRTLTHQQFTAEIKRTLPFLNPRRDHVWIVSLETEHSASVRGVSIRCYHGQWAVQNRCGTDLKSALYAALAYYSREYGDDWDTTVDIRKLVTRMERRR